MRKTVRTHLFSTIFHNWFAFASLVVCGGIASGLLTGCGKKTSDANTVSDTASADFRVALLTPGPISDQAWNAGAYAGLLRVRDSLGAKISHIQTKTPAEIEENFRQYGAQGYALVFGHGFEFQDPAVRVAPDFPNTQYVNVSATKTGKNVSGIEFSFRDGAYLAGIVAGANTKTNVLGVIGGTELPPVVDAFNAFAAGAKSVNPKVQILTSYVGNWDDVSAAKEQALAQIARGADMLFQNADNAGLGVFQAARQSPHVRAFGTNSDQNHIAPDVILGSVIIDLPHAFMLVGKEVKNHTFTPRVIQLGAHDDVIRWIPNPTLAQEITPATRAIVDSVNARIKAGTFTFPK